MLPVLIQALPWLAGAATAAALWLLRRRLRRRRSQDSPDSAPQSQPEPQPQPASNIRPLQPEDAAPKEPDTAEAEEKVRQILNGDPRVGQRLANQAGQAHRDLQDMARDRDAVRDIVRRVPDWMIEMLHIASQQKEMKFDLQQQETRQPVEYPTSDLEPEAMQSIDQLPNILPEQQLEDDDTYYSHLAQNELLVLQGYERRVDQKLMYLLLDVSGSMKEAMANGLPRHIWARGVTVNLLLQAVNGQAKYFLRPFDGAPHELLQATTPEEADRLIDVILNTGFSGGGTDIQLAILTAIDDIRNRGGDISRSEILLISDGESGIDLSEIRRRLGKDIRLHVVLLGHSDSELSKITTTFHTLQ